MNILINDHSGHSFTLQLSRQLASMGYTVLHSYSTSFQSPKGDFKKKETDANSLTIFPIANKEIFAKYSLLKRRKQEIEYAKILVDKLQSFKPDIVLTGNTPLFVQDFLQKYCIKSNIKFIYWCQDIYAVAIEKIVKKKIGFIGFPVWSYFKQLERKLLSKSNHIIAITDDFKKIFDSWGISTTVTCIPNWSAFV
nr:glycosyltransferase [Chitinophagaceae bacterium]